VTTPRMDIDRTTSWCDACEATSDDPDWAGEHNTETGHQTRRRMWRTETWPGEQRAPGKPLQPVRSLKRRGKP
jgi:hypothetical protein